MADSKRFRRINIEISNICNLQCSFCPEVKRDKQVMGPDLFERVIGAVAGRTDEVCLHLMGEPLGHPRLDDMLTICQNHNVPVNISTNGLLLTGSKVDAVLRPSVRQVNISLHSFSANFPDRDPAPYMEKVFRFTRRALQERPDLYVNYRLWDLDGELSGDPANMRIRTMICERFGIDWSAVKIDPRHRKGHALGTGRLYLNFDSRFDWPSPDAPHRTTRGTCHGLSNHIGVLADGTVVPCCLDKEGVMALGNLRDQSLSDILSGPRASAIRDGFARHELVEDLCQKCTFISRFDRKVARAEAQGTRSQTAVRTADQESLTGR